MSYEMQIGDRTVIRAHIGLRLGAFIVDVLVTLGVGVAVSIPVMIFWAFGVDIGWLVLLAMAAYLVGSNALGISVGKYLFGIRVVMNRTGEEPGLIVGAWRVLMLLACQLLLLIPPAWIAFELVGTPGINFQLKGDQRRLHEQLSGTVVIQVVPFKQSPIAVWWRKRKMARTKSAHPNG